jgi:uncharacterized protein YjeT (DUF2065 family)
MLLVILGIILIVFGIIYQVKPDLFKRWFWKRTSIAQRLLSPEAYTKYMKGLGWFYIIGGIILCVIGFAHS